MGQQQNRKAQALTGLLIAAIAVFLVARQRGFAPGDVGGAVSDVVSNASGPPLEKALPSPQDAIYGMLDAARAGDVRAYMGYFTGQMTTLLEQSLAENGEAKFAEYLKRTNAPIKGIAITEPERLTGREVKARVEYVYADRNEVQVMFVVEVSGEWKIARLEETERVKTLVPYGTPVR